MSKKVKPKLVHCRYPKCKFLHETTELVKEEAVKGGSKNSYYHPDCWKTMQTVNQIRDTFCKEVDTTLTGKQIGSLVSIVNNMIFSKGEDPDYILFALRYFIKYKNGALKYPPGITYIVQDKDVIKTWNEIQEKKIETQIKEKQKEIQEKIQKEIELNNDSDLMIHIENNKGQNKKSRFSSVLKI